MADLDLTRIDWRTGQKWFGRRLGSITAPELSDEQIAELRRMHAQPGCQGGCCQTTLAWDSKKNSQ